MDEAEKALKEAERLLNTRPSSFLGFFSMPGSGPDYHEAAEKYTIAGNLFKSVGEWQRAGSAYLRASECCEREELPEEAARKKMTAAGCFRKAPGLAEEAINLFTDANAVYIRSGRFAMVGANEKEMADICERDLHDLERAADYYGKAAERYLAESSPASAYGCRQKEAQVSADAGLFDRAIAIYEESAKQDASDASKKFNVKDALFRAGLCRLANGDLIGAKKAIEAYPNIDPSFGNSREFKLLTSLLEAIEEHDPDAFTAAVEEFERINSIDDWKVNLIYKAKQSIDAEPSLA